MKPTRRQLESRVVRAAMAWHITAFYQPNCKCRCCVLVRACAALRSKGKGGR